MKRVEKAILYQEETDTYTVRFNFREESTFNNFPTLELAREFRDKVYKEKAELKAKLGVTPEQIN